MNHVVPPRTTSTIEVLRRPLDPLVLAADRGRPHDRGRGGGRGRVDAGREQVVSTRWWDVADQPGRALRALPVLLRAGGDCAIYGPRSVKNGPPLAGHGAEAVNTAIAAQFAARPEQLRRSLTWDQGTELSQHVQLKIDTGLQVYFCDPRSHPGSAAATRTPTVCYASTSPKAPTCPAGTATTSPQSPPP